MDDVPAGTDWMITSFLSSGHHLPICAVLRVSWRGGVGVIVLTVDFEESNGLTS